MLCLFEIELNMIQGMENPVLATQNAFLIGVYEMYSMRPVKALFSFNRASVIFQAYLHCSPRNTLNTYDKRMEQRLYWTCLKSECEMREELNLVSSGLAGMEYPNIFPSPPDNILEPEDGPRDRITDELQP